MVPGFQNRFRLCEVFGIPLYLDLSLAFLLLLFATGGNGFLAGLLGAALLLFSITAHELGHALTARAFGYGTHDITLSLLGGCASLIALPRKASQEFLTAVAGPAVSFALSVLGICGVQACAVEGGLADAALYVVEDVLASFGLDVRLGGELAVLPRSVWMVRAMLYLSVMNAMLGLFNLLPGFPMDGGRVFRSAMRAFMSRARATFVAMVVGRVFAVLLASLALYRMVRGDGAWNFVTLLIAWLVWKEGYREYRQTLAESLWEDPFSYSARVSPPPYGGKSSRTEIRRGTSQ